jgi:transcriptional regulator with XRE-family HTH domain
MAIQLNAKTFGGRVLEILKERDDTQLWLADKSGLTQAAISQIISGHRLPSISSACAIAQALNVSIDHLCGRKNK